MGLNSIDHFVIVFVTYMMTNFEINNIIIITVKGIDYLCVICDVSKPDAFILLED